MSEPIPESIPTSADPRSKRPLKKRQINNNSKNSENASQITALFAKPDQTINIPSSTTASSSTTLEKKNNIGAPPEIVQNVQGSSAGAGSGEFHVYKASRRREYERLRRMDEEVREEEEAERFESEKRERELRDEEKTRRNREKRGRKKGKKGGVGGMKDGEGDVKGNAGKGGVKANPSLTAARAEDKAQDEEGNVEVEEQVGVITHDDD